MATLELILLLLAAVLISSVLDQVIPKVTSPLIQIVLGIVIAVLASGRISITLDSDLFLVVFIAPLLFNEAREADKTSLWKNKGSLLSYAIGLVILITLGVGFAVHLLVPSISLAAAFALGAALGPTDAVAVASVSRDADIPKRQATILQGESLLNDASGIVSFQFALAAAITGAFSLVSAVESFLLEFLGGIALGIVLGWLANLIIRQVREWGLDNTTFHVLFELFTPFIVYIIGNSLHVSGVLCVVACGIVMSLTPQNLGPTDSRLNIVSSSVWRVLSYTLNGIVFVLLGTQLPNALGNSWNNVGINEFELVALVLLITVIMHGLRLIWSLATELAADRRAKQKRTFGKRLRAALITTLSGAKGTITLAIMFTIPAWISTGNSTVNFPNRDLLIFLASGVILVSLLLATYVVPLLAPTKDEQSHAAERDVETKIEIMRRVIEELSARQTKENHRATYEVVRQYNVRITRIQNANDIDEGSNAQLLIRTLQWEQEYLWELIDSGQVPPREGYRYLTQLARHEALVRNDKMTRAYFTYRLRRRIAALKSTFHHLRNKMPGDTEANDVRQMVRARVTSYAIGKLQHELQRDEFPSESVSQLILEMHRTLVATTPTAPSVTAYTQREANSEDIRRQGLRIELAEIEDAYDDGRLSRACAQEMRRNVYLMQLDMEDYV